MKPTSLIPVVACALALPFGVAHAGFVQTTLDYSDLKFQVIDLTPNDGIDAGFTLTGSNSRLTLQVLDATGAVVDELKQTFPGSTVTPTVLSGHGRSVDAFADTGAGGVSALNGADAGDGSARAQLHTTWNFNLAPGTGLVVTGTIDSTISREPGHHYSALGGAVSLQGFGSLALNGGQYEGYSATSSTGHLWDFGVDRPYTDYLGLTLLNIGSSTVDGTLQLTSTANVYSRIGNPPPIPEPATYLMLGTGLLVAGVAARRRRPR